VLDQLRAKLPHFLGDSSGLTGEERDGRFDISAVVEVENSAAGC
jgi:hypothetical protein